MKPLLELAEKVVAYDDGRLTQDEADDLIRKLVERNHIDDLPSYYRLAADAMKGRDNAPV